MKMIAIGFRCRSCRRRSCSRSNFSLCCAEVLSVLSRGVLSRGGPCGLTGGASERAPLSTVKLARVLLGTVDRQWQIPVLLSLLRARALEEELEGVRMSKV